MTLEYVTSWYCSCSYQLHPAAFLFTLNNVLHDHALCRRDVRLPVELQHAMAAEAEAAREARAKVIAAEGEQNSAIAYAEAADIMAQEPGALQLRYLQTLQTTAGEKDSTILFPLPLADMGFAQLSPEYAMRHRKSEEPLIDLSP